MATHPSIPSELWDRTPREVQNYIRKRSSGTASVKGNRWVERILSLRQTCCQLGQSSFAVLVDALSSSFSGRQPDLSWLY